MTADEGQQSSWLDRPLFSSFKLNWEIVIFSLIVILAIATRFYILGARVISHDENSHVYYSWLYYQGEGYRHDPVTHGPLQFHLVALSFFLFGDSDFTAHLPAALFSIATVFAIWLFRRYLGNVGTLVAAFIFVISPYMLFYARYVRNESFITLFGVLTLWAILRYLETGRPRYLYLLTLATVLHFTAKETSFIYTAQAMIFLAFYMVYDLTRKAWPKPKDQRTFLTALLIGIIFLALAMGLLILTQGTAPAATPTVAPTPGPGQGLENPAASPSLPVVPLLTAGIGLVALLFALFILIRGYTWQALRTNRAFSMLIVLLVIVLPMLSPFPVKAMGFNPIDYNNPQSIFWVGAISGLLAILAIIIGLLWNPKLFLINAAIFYSIFTVLYTSIFTNGFGFVTGLVGSLGYWLAQQSVNRGSQPWYYYMFLQIPVYEFLAAYGSLLAVVIVIYRWITGRKTSESEIEPEPEVQPAFEPEDGPDSNELIPPEAIAAPLETEVEEQVKPPVFALLLYWSVTSLLAYSAAGEKMPWLTVHIALPMILLSGWAFGIVIDGFSWEEFRRQRGWLTLLLFPVFLTSLLAASAALLGANPPFQGSSLDQLQVTTTFITSAILAVASGIGLYILVKGWDTGQFLRLVILVIAGFFSILTARTAFRAAYINYDNAKEFLVYAHSAGGVKQALAQIQEISERTTGGDSIKVAYDDQTTYPYWWYLRNYPNQMYYGANPTRALRDAPVILVGDTNFGKIEPVVAQGYDRFDYIRLWWPMQDYFDLTPQRIIDEITDPQMREALFDIWFNRDYTLYGDLTKKDFSLENWEPSARMRLYVRKDIVAKLWNYGTSPVPEQVVVDPFDGKQINLSADLLVGSAGDQPGMFKNPRDLAVAPDGSLYVADSGNHRIQHLDKNGNVIKVWGSFTGENVVPAPGGTFNEPWGIGVGPDGSVYVADTWNHRIQMFTADGVFVKAWGYFGQAEKPEAFWGPRDILVDSQGRVFVTDTGNKRVVVFDKDGNYLTEFGKAGLNAGEFDEPVGLAMDASGRVYVADTWNQRIQVFKEDGPNNFVPDNAWDIVGWYGQSTDNKPFLAADGSGNLFATDPEANRILEFGPDNKPLRAWGDYSTGADGFNIVGSVAWDGSSGVWVTDVGNARVMHFTLP